jgi:hypothetical protein
MLENPLHDLDGILFIVTLHLDLQTGAQRRTQGQDTKEAAQVRHLAATLQHHGRVKPPRRLHQPAGRSQMQAMGPGHCHAYAFHVGSDPLKLRRVRKF